MGVDKKRIRLEWISASEGKEFAELANEFSETIKKLGKSNIKEEMKVEDKKSPESAVHRPARMGLQSTVES